MTRRTLWLAAFVVALPAGMSAQDTLIVVRPGRVPARSTQLEQWAVDVFNASTTTRIFGSEIIDHGTEYVGDVAVFEGPLLVRGVVRGDLVAVNADVELRNGARIEGDLVVLGGGVLSQDAGTVVRGSIRAQDEPVPVRRVGDRLELREEAERRVVRPRRTVWREPRPNGSASLIVGFTPTYNRVEGLPLRGGARMAWWTDDVRIDLHGYGIFRTVGDWSGRDDIGYHVEATVEAGRAAGITVGGRAFDEVRSVEGWPLTLHEVGWGTLLWHRDYRDYYLQRGIAGFLALRPVAGVSLTGEIATVDETSIAARDPWTLFRRDELWRPNPVIDGGDFTLYRAELEYTRRAARRSAWSGWYLRGTWERGVGANLTPRLLPTVIRAPIPADDYTFTRVSADVRRYQRVGWHGLLGLRAFWAGALDGDPLPVQRRFSLGGPDPMNGFPFRAMACNAGVPDASQPALCDRVLLLQAEYRGGLGIDWPGSRWDHRAYRNDDDDDGPPFGLEDVWFDGPTLVVFSNAGKAWLHGQDSGDFEVDVGAGIEFGSVGLYLAKALTEEHDLRMTLRIERRF